MGALPEIFKFIPGETDADSNNKIDYLNLDPDATESEGGDAISGIPTPRRWTRPKSRDASKLPSDQSDNVEPLAEEETGESVKRAIIKKNRKPKTSHAKPKRAVEKSESLVPPKAKASVGKAKKQLAGAVKKKQPKR